MPGKRLLMAAKLTPAAQKLKGMKLKEMFDCVELADREVERFKGWFSRNYGMPTEEAPSGDIAHAIYHYCQERYTKRKPDEVIWKEGKLFDTYKEGAEGQGFVLIARPDVMRRAEVWDRKSWRLRPETNKEFHDRVNRLSEFMGQGSSELRGILEERKGNCTAFTALYCMLAEEVGVDARPFLVKRFEDNKRYGLSAGKIARGGIGHVVAAFIKENGKYLLFDPIRGVANPKHEGRVMDRFMLYVYALSNKGSEISTEGGLKEGLQYVNRALRIDPHNTGALCNKAAIYRELDNRRMAMKYLRRAIDEDPENVAALTDLSAAYFYSGQPKKALETLELTVEIDPKNNIALHNITVIMYTLATTIAVSEEKAREAYEIALGYVNRADDGRPFGLTLAYKVLILLRLGRIRAAKECLKGEDAEELIRVCTQIDPEVRIA